MDLKRIIKAGGATLITGKDKTFEGLLDEFTAAGYIPAAVLMVSPACNAVVPLFGGNKHAMISLGKALQHAGKKLVETSEAMGDDE